MTRPRLAPSCVLPRLLPLIGTGLAIALVAPVGPVAPASATHSPPVLTPRGETISEGAGRARVVVKLSAPTRLTLHVPFQTVAGTAKAGKDFRTTKGKLTIKKGARSGSIWIPLVNDTKSEPPEQFKVRLRDGATYNLKTTTATVTIKDDDHTTVDRWSGDLTVHVTKHNDTGNGVVGDEDWTMLLHLVLTTDANHTTWIPTSASSWSAQGTTDSSHPGSQCDGSPTHREFETSGSFVANPVTDSPVVGQSSYWLHGIYGNQSIDKTFPTPPVLEAGITNLMATSTSTSYGSQGCQQTVSQAQVSLGFQTAWRTSNPVGHPGTFPLTIHSKNGNETSLSVDFSDTYHQSAGMTTTSRVTGTLYAD